MKTKLTKLALFGIIALFSLNACEFLPIDPDGGDGTENPKENELILFVPYNKAILVDKDLTIKFKSLVEDSRCPLDADCVWSGNAKIVVELSLSNGKTMEAELNTNVSPSEVIFEDYLITLSDLAPYPTINKMQQNPELYNAKFTIKKN